MTLLFQEDQHKYFFLEKPEQELTSVSKLIEIYHEKFDTEKISAKTAKKRGVDQAELKAQWKEENSKSLIRGKAFHAAREQKLIKSGKNVIAPIEENGFKKAFDITKLKPGIYVESILYHPYYGIVGTADKFEIFDDLTFTLDDVKTNKKLDFKSFEVFNPNTYIRTPKKMFFPINHIDDCNGQHYSLQLSAYSFMLEEAGYSLKKGGLHIEHILFENDEPVDIIIYPINYLKKEIKTLFEHYNNNNNKNKNKTK